MQLYFLCLIHYFSCRICSKYRRHLGLSRQESGLANPEGVLYESPERNDRFIRGHAHQWSHLDTIYDLKTAKLRLRGSSLAQMKQEDQHLFVTNNIMSAAYAAQKLVVPFNQHPNLVKFLKSVHVDTGTRCKTKDVARVMSEVIYTSIHDEFVQMLKDQQAPLTLLGTKHLECLQFEWGREGSNL